MSANWDLSRLLDRVFAVYDELEDLGLSKVDGERDDELRKHCTEALFALSPLLCHIEERLTYPATYERDDTQEALS